jgi:hypothetical protein
MQFQAGWMADPLFFGDYPEVRRALKNKDMQPLAYVCHAFGSYRRMATTHGEAVFITVVCRRLKPFLWQMQWRATVCGACVTEQSKKEWLLPGTVTVI